MKQPCNQNKQIRQALFPLKFVISKGNVIILQTYSPYIYCENTKYLYEYLSTKTDYEVYWVTESKEIKKYLIDGYNQIKTGTGTAPIKEAGLLIGINALMDGKLVEIETIEDFFHDAENSTLFHIAGIIHPKLFIKDIF